MIDIDVLWRDQPSPRKEPVILGVRWRELPIKIRRLWWCETDYSRRPPSPEFLARLPQLLADATRELENDKRELAADTAKARELLRQARRPPCEDCRRPDSACRVRCLRSMGVAERPEPETVRRKPYVDLANAPPWLRKILQEHFPDPSKVIIEDLEEKLAMLRRREAAELERQRDQEPKP